MMSAAATMSAAITRPSATRFASANCFASSIVESTRVGETDRSIRCRINEIDSSRIAALTRREHARDDVEVQERLAEERELRRRPQTVRAGALAHVEQQAADLQLCERRVLARRHELHDLLAQRVLVERVH